MQDNDTSEPASYVRTDADGVMRVGDTDVPIDSVLAGFDRGDSPESIRLQYPSLTLEQVYGGAITYYLAHQDEVHAYLRRQDLVWREARQRAEQDRSPVVERLRTLMRDPARQSGQIR